MIGKILFQKDSVKLQANMNKHEFQRIYDLCRPLMYTLTVTYQTDGTIGVLVTNEHCVTVNYWHLSQNKDSYIIYCRQTRTKGKGDGQDKLWDLVAQSLMSIQRNFLEYSNIPYEYYD